VRKKPRKLKRRVIDSDDSEADAVMAVAIAASLDDSVNMCEVLSSDSERTAKPAAAKSQSSTASSSSSSKTTPVDLTETSLEEFKAAAAAVAAGAAGISLTAAYRRDLEKQANAAAAAAGGSSSSTTAAQRRALAKATKAAAAAEEAELSADGAGSESDSGNEEEQQLAQAQAVLEKCRALSEQLTAVISEWTQGGVREADKRNGALSLSVVSYCNMLCAYVLAL
jgi:hypothetical protein